MWLDDNVFESIQSRVQLPEQVDHNYATVFNQSVLQEALYHVLVPVIIYLI